MVHPLYDQFCRDVLEAQKNANSSNSGVHVSLRGQSTLVEPNLPKMTKKEIDRRFNRIMTDADFEEMEDSVSILSRPDRNKLTRSKSKSSTT